MWEENTLYGPYAITQDGRIEGMILVNKDIPISILVTNPYGSNVDYNCSFDLKRTNIGEPMDDSVIVLESDGSCRILKESELYDW